MQLNITVSCIEIKFIVMCIALCVIIVSLFIVQFKITSKHILSVKISLELMVDLISASGSRIQIK